MKANKLLKTLAASAMALALMASVTAVPAMAAGVTGSDGKEAHKVTQITVTDNITTDGYTFAPPTTMNILVEEGKGKSFNDGKNDITAVAGVESGLTGCEIEFAPSGTAPQASYTATGYLTVNADVFEATGVYHYEVSQKVGNYEGLTYDTATYDVYLYVMNNATYTGFYVGYAVCMKQVEGVATKADLVFNNNYDTDNSKLHDLTLYKVISGDAANMKDKFQFTVKIDGDAGEKYYVERGTYDNNTFTSNGTTMTLVSGESATIQLGNKDALKVYSLDGTESYTIEEIGDNSNGYTLKINEKADDDGIINGTVTGETTVKYENNKNASTPTGVILNVAPYALMVVIAVAGVAVFMRKRVED